MRRALAIAFASILLLSRALPASALPLADASEPPPSPDDALDDLDARAGMCDRFDGLAFTFCVALCEARACDLLDPDDQRCALLRDGFTRASGGGAPPCDEATPAPASLRAS